MRWDYLFVGLFFIGLIVFFNSDRIMGRFSTSRPTTIPPAPRAGASHWYANLGKGMGKIFSPGWIVSLIIIIAVWHLIYTEIKAPPSPPAKPAVYCPPPRPVYVCRDQECYQIIARPGDPRDPNAWARADEVVIPDHCAGSIKPQGKVWWKDEFGGIHQDCPEIKNAGYTRGGNRHVRFLSRSRQAVVVAVNLSPKYFR